MARPTKTKIDYFPLYCDYDERTEYLIARFGFEGYGVYISLLKRIYGGHGYYLNCNERSFCIFANSGNVELRKFDEILNCLLDEGIFDRDIYEKHSVLTSKEIQENYLYAVSKRKNIRIDAALRLVNTEETEVNSEETQVNSSEIQQRKENKIKENNIKREGENKENFIPTPTPEKARGEFNNVILTEGEYDALASEYKGIDRTIERLSQYMAATGKSYVSHYAVLRKWADEDKAKKVGKSDNSSYDINEFFEFALKRSDEKMLQKRGVSGA